MFENVDKFRNKINELFSNIKMIKSFVREKEEVKELVEYLKPISDNDQIKMSIIFQINNIIQSLQYPILLIFVGKLILEGKAH